MIRNILHIIVFLLMVQNGIGQQKLHVVTRVIEESFDFKREFLLEIGAEKANITVKPTTGNKVTIKLSQTVKDKNRKVAEELLEAHHYTLKKERNRLFVRNYLLFGSSVDNANSIFQSKYEIQVPVNLCHLKITNQLGDIVLQGLKKSIQLNVDYGKINISEVESKLLAEVKIGDLIVKNSKLDAVITASNSLVSVNRCSGVVRANLDFGSFSTTLQNDLNSLEIEAENTDISIINPDKEIYTMFIENAFGDINSVEFNDNILENNNVKFLELKHASSVGIIRINNKYGNINIY